MKSKSTNRLLLIIAAMLFLAVLVVVAFEISYGYKIYPRTYAGKVNLTGKTKNQAVEELTTKTDPLITNGLNFVFEEKKVNISSLITGGGDIFEEVYSYNIRQTVNQAYDYGHVGDWSKRFPEQFDALFNKKTFPIQFNLNEEGLETILRDNFLEIEKPAVDAELEITVEDGAATINIKEEVVGQTFDYKKAISDAKNNILNFEQKDIVLQAIDDEPKIKKWEVENIIPQAQEILELAPLTFIYNNKEWELSKAELASWLKSNKQGEIDPPQMAVGLPVGLVINIEEAEKFLSAIAVDVDVETLDAKFEINNGRVSQFQSSRNGLKLDLEKTIQEVDGKLLKEKTNIIELIVEQIEPKVQNADVNDLGIVELIGRGVSDFSGSPQNRIHNITNGANSLNGLLIKPDETFSLLEALGEIDAESGYLPELVIKGNKTIPEYGGGLCQIGTTTFRVALQSGLPIVERRNHSYDVSYYHPTGTDATIYGPHPDVRFTNDTGKHILFLTKVEWPKLTFEFWGTKDGRGVKFNGKEETSDFTKLVPVVYNVVYPGGAKYIETDTLEPGKKKRIEYSHRGVDAKFDYIVTYADGEVEEQTFTSHYVPWREVWLIGVEEKEEEDAEDEDVEGEEESSVGEE